MWMRRLTLIVCLLAVATALAFALWQPSVREWLGTLASRGTNEVRTQSADAEEADKPTQNGQLVAAHKEGDGTDEAKGERDKQGVELSPDQLRDFGIEVAVAGPGPISMHIERPAEVKFNGDRVVHVVPRVGGVVSQVLVSQGQDVSKDTLMAVLNSRELAELKASYHADFERRNLARETFERESRLWEKKISSEKDYLDAKTALAQAEIALHLSGQKLIALGFSQQFVDALPGSEDADLTRYEIPAPISGTIIERHASLGESVSTDKELFILADASAVWVEVTVYPRDLPLVRTGQSVSIDVGDGNPIAGEIAFVTPQLSEETRTGVARVITDNAEGRLKPGMFVKAQVAIGEPTVPVRVAKSAIQTDEEHSSVVFVQHGDKFEPRPVQLGNQNTEFVEIRSGLKAGEAYVSNGAFTLKAELSKGSFAEQD
jgi:cobalt-zinc-cadmium efflux system membrane fusion protein